MSLGREGKLVRLPKAPFDPTHQPLLSLQPEMLLATPGGNTRSRKMDGLVLPRL